MNKFVMLLAAAGVLVAAPAIVKAEEHAAPAAAAEVKAEAAAETAVEHELADGTKVYVEGDAVSVVAADGTKTPAPDGEHKLKDGTTVTVKDGKLVK